jgi:hypothetical protein
MVETKFLVNGVLMTNTEYVELLKKSREAINAYKTTPVYKKEQEAKAQANQEVEVNIQKFEQFAKSLKVSDLALAKVSLILYNKYRTKKED